MFSPGTPLTRKLLKKTAVPSIFSWTHAPSSSAVSRKQRAASRQAQRNKSSFVAQENEPSGASIEELVPSGTQDLKDIPILCAEVDVTIEEPCFKDQECQASPLTEKKSVQTDVSHPSSVPRMSVFLPGFKTQIFSKMCFHPLALQHIL